MRNIITIAWNMVKRMIGSKKGVLTFIVVPCAVIAGIIAISGIMEESDTIILYHNSDQGPAGRHVLEELAGSVEYKLVEKAEEKALKDAVIGQKGELGLSIPAGYTDALLAGQRPQISVYELKVSETGTMVKLKARELGERLAAAAKAAGVQQGETGAADDHEAKLAAILQQAEQHNIGSKRTDYNLYPRRGLGTVTGMTLMFLMGLVTSSVSVIMEDRRGRTMLRMFSAPVRGYEIAAGNFIGSVIVGMIQIVVILSLGHWVMRYDYQLPLYLYALVLAAFMLVSMGIASTVAGLIRNPNNAGMLNALILTPTCMLGGCFWPLSIMPDYMQKAANFVPQKWAIEAVDIAAAGGSWSELWLPFAILGLMAALLLAVGSAILRPSETGAGA